MLRNGVKTLLFLTSYIPLYVILMVRNYGAAFELFWGLLIFTAAIITLVAIVFLRVYRISGDYTKIDEVENVNSVNLEYFIAYVFPFITEDLLQLDNAISFAIVMFIMGIIYVRSDLIHMNPPLNIIGFNVYKVKSEGKELIVISRKKKEQLSSSEELIRLGDNVMLGKTRKWMKQ